jgi:hypothetical protein
LKKLEIKSSLKIPIVVASAVVSFYLKNISGQTRKTSISTSLPNETEETRQWNNTELQRVVLLEQLSCFRQMKAFYESVTIFSAGVKENIPPKH